MRAARNTGLPTGIRKRATSGRPGYAYEVYAYERRLKKQVFEVVGTDLRAAVRRLAEMKREIAAGTFQPGVRAGATMTVESFAERWLEERERDGVKTIADNRTAFERHILPVLGKMAVAEVEPKHIVALHTELRQKPSARGTLLAQNTVRNIHALLVTLFNDAEQQGFTPRNPCHGLRASQKPKKAPRHATQKATFTVAQIEALVFDARIPPDRRVLYAVQFFTGARFGEAVGARWADYSEATRDGTLGEMRIERQYDGEPLKGRRNEPGAPRLAPVHATLAAILDEWRSEGFPSFFGREPAAQDFIVPSREGNCRSLRHSAKKLAQDKARVGIADERQATHPFRSAFKTIALANGAGEAWIERIIHNASGGVAAAYLMDDWQAMSRAVLAIPVRAPATPPTSTAVNESHVAPVATATPETRAANVPPTMAPTMASEGRKDESPAVGGALEAGWTGLEPAASGVTGRRYNQLNYHPRW